MGKLSEAKILGGIGALLMVLGGIFLPGIGAIIGLILLFVAVKYITEETNDQSIFDNYLMHFICSIIAIVAVVLIFFLSIGGFSLTFFKALETMNFTDFNSVWNFFAPYIMWWIVALVIGWVFFIISALYLRKSYNSIADHTKIHTFKTTGLIYFIGAITIIIGVGFIIILVAKIFEIVAYFSLPANLQSTNQS
jgi:uncharacterized membrane protein